MTSSKLQMELPAPTTLLHAAGGWNGPAGGGDHETHVLKFFKNRRLPSFWTFLVLCGDGFQRLWRAPSDLLPPRIDINSKFLKRPIFH